MLLVLLQHLEGDSLNGRVVHFVFTLGETLVIILRFLEFALIIVGASQIVVDEQLGLYTFSFPGVLQSLLEDDDRLCIQFDLDSYHPHSDKSFCFNLM